MVIPGRLEGMEEQAAKFQLVNDYAANQSRIACLDSTLQRIADCLSGASSAIRRNVAPPQTMEDDEISMSHIRTLMRERRQLKERQVEMYKNLQDMGFGGIIKPE